MFTGPRHNLVKRISSALALVISARCFSAPAVEWGINGHPFSQSAYFDISLEKQLDLVVASGARWYRIDVSEENFQASTARMDELINISEKRGIRILPVLVATRGSGKIPEIRKSAAQFARNIVSRYKGRITHWELGNELDDYSLIRKGDTTRAGKQWIWGDPDGSHADDYEESRYQWSREEILGLCDGVRSADPSAKTIVDTAGWLHYGFIERLVDEDHVPFDILSWHWYSEMGDMTRVQGSLDLVAYLGRFGKPLWLTEVGRRGGSAMGGEREQAAFMTGDLRRLGENPGIGALFIYELLDEPYFGDAGESQYGLVTVEKDPKGHWVVAGHKEAFIAFSSVAHPAPKS